MAGLGAFPPSPALHISSFRGIKVVFTCVCSLAIHYSGTVVSRRGSTPSMDYELSTKQPERASSRYSHGEPQGNSPTCICLPCLVYACGVFLLCPVYMVFLPFLFNSCSGSLFRVFYAYTRFLYFLRLMLTGVTLSFSTDDILNYVVYFLYAYPVYSISVVICSSAVFAFLVLYFSLLCCYLLRMFPGCLALHIYL